MELLVHDKEKITVSDKVWACDFNEGLIHQVVTAYLAGARAGTKAQKTRREVSGGGSKPWRQKGTGRARAGSIRSPLWRGGGIIFAAKPRNYSQKVNKKMYYRALSSILSELLRQERFIVVETLSLANPKTQELLGLLQKFAFEGGLIVTETDDHKVNLAARNVPCLDVCTAAQVNPVNLVAAEKVLITLPALKRLEERLV